MSSASASPQPPSGQKKTMGPKPWSPSRGQRLKAIYAFSTGATQETVATILGKSKETIQRHLDLEYRFASQIANAVLSQRLWHKAIAEGDTACLIFLAKNRLGMTDRRELNHTGELPVVREELSLRVEYVLPTDPRANGGPPQALLDGPKPH